MDLMPGAAAVGVAVDSVDVVVTIHRMTVERIPAFVRAGRSLVQAEPLEEHHGYVDAPFAGRDDPRAKSVEERQGQDIRRGGRWLPPDYPFRDQPPTSSFQP